MYIVVIIYASINICTAQNNKYLDLKSCNIAVDSLTILPSSVKVWRGDSIVSDSLYYTEDNQVLLKQEYCYIKDSTLKVFYRTFDFRIGQTLNHLDTTKLQLKDFVVYIGYDYSPYQNTNNQALINAKGLDYNGSFTRGFSVGNSQSLVLNSNFNLQLAGDLGNGLKIVAAISDDNIPIQPQGNTQLLQEFDQVYIRLTKDNTTVVAGDYQQGSKNSYFMRYFKKLKGASAGHIQNLGKKSTLDSRASFAVSKGKFNRYNLEVQEGNQGPYKLVGAEGERFLIVLAGSERIYYDGTLLQRGEDYDYVIDYNRAEITFTPRRIIARESRIIAEYEYTDQNYLRTLYTVESAYSTPKFDISTQLYSEQDSKNGSGQANLDSLDRLILANSGDDFLSSFRSGIKIIDEDNGANGRITYSKEDNLDTPDPTDFILRYNTDETQVLFTAIFTEVSMGQGDYAIDEEIGANGRVYKYVGQNMGSYIPFIRIVPPEQKQLLTSRIDYHPSKNTSIYGEIGLSNKDINRLSTINDEDNQGMAAHIGINQIIELDSAATWKLATTADYEYVQNNFRALNPFRNAEFQRDWSINNTLNSDERIINSKLSISKSSKFQLGYGLSTYDRLEEYSGVKQLADLKLSINNWELIAKGNYLKSEGYGETSTFLRPRIDLSKQLAILGGWTVGYSYESEKNNVKEIDSETVLNRSFKFQTNRAFIQTNNESALSLKLELRRRLDELPNNGLLQSAIKTNELSSDTKWKINANNELNWALGIRDFKVSDEDAFGQKSKTTLLSRLSYNATAIKGLIKSTMNYDISSGQEPKQEFTYEKVASGQGDYIYIGNSNSSESEELFLYEYRPDIDTANYIKVFLYNNEFIRTNNQILNINVRVSPSNVIKSNKNIFSKIATTHSVRLNQKIEDNGAESNFKALNFSFNNPSLTAYNSFVSNTLFFNRSSTTFDVQLGNRHNKSRTVQIAGLEDRTLGEYFSRIRCQIFQGVDFITHVINGQKTYNSNFYQIRNFEIDYWKISPEINFRPGSNWRVITKYTYDNRHQNLREMETAKSHDFTLETTFRQATKASYNVNFTLVNVQYDGLPNTTIEYDLLEGLKNGKNYLWNFNITRRMANNVDLNISYDGRKTGTNPILHVARAQIKATF